MLPQSLETQSLSVAKWKPQITDLSLEIGWERDSWIPHIMPPGLYYVIFTCFETWWKHIMWYSITWYLPVSKLDESILCCTCITWYLPVSKLDESILCCTCITWYLPVSKLDESILCDTVLRDIYLFRNLMKAYYVIQYYVIFTCFETWWKHIMWYSITWYLPVSKLDESILCCNSITWYLPVSKLDESILCDTVLRDIYLFRNLMKAYYVIQYYVIFTCFETWWKHIMWYSITWYLPVSKLDESILCDTVLRDIYLFRNLMKAYYVIQYYVIFTCFETWWKHIML